MKLLTVDLESPLPDIPPPTVGEQWVLVRLHQQPMGILQFVRGCPARQLSHLVVERFHKRILRHLTADAIAGGTSSRGLLRAACPRRAPFDHPAVTVAVCSRGGAARLPECLDAIAALAYPAGKLERLLVDNAPADDSTRRLVGERYPSIRYVVERAPGLDRARNRAIREARGDIIAFTDDDASVDAGWAEALARVFVSEPDAEAVTGLVVADEMDVDAQRLFEAYGGFGRGFDRQYARVDSAARERAATRHGGAGRFGTGANMAFRRRIFDRIGLFDPALDVGTPTNGGGDLEMFFRVLKEGGTLVYEPSAIVRHRHRQTYDALRVQLTNNGIGFYSYLVRSARSYPDERAALLRLAIGWFARWNVGRLARSVIQPSAFPRDLILAELTGSIAGVRRYGQSRRAAEMASAAEAS